MPPVASPSSSKKIIDFRLLARILLPKSLTARRVRVEIRVERRWQTDKVRPYYYYSAASPLQLIIIVVFFLIAAFIFIS